jgi:hypothetical protein
MLPETCSNEKNYCAVVSNNKNLICKATVRDMYNIKYFYSGVLNA